MTSKNIVVFNALDLVVTDTERKDWLFRGVSEGFSKSKQLFLYLRSLGFEVTMILGRGRDIPSELCFVNCEYVSNEDDLFKLVNILSPTISFFWNGSEPTTYQAQWWLASVGSKIMYLEYGFFPQGDYIRVSTGFSLSASNRTSDSLYSQVTHDEVDEFLTHLRTGFEFPSHGGSLVVLQTDMDSSLLIGSRFKTMLSFLRYLKDRNFYFYDKKIRFHPKMLKHSAEELEDCISNMKVDTCSSPLEALKTYEYFFGINSTLLYEAHLIGRKVINYGFLFAENSRDLYSGFEYEQYGFDVNRWKERVRSRDKSFYFLYRYRQFHVSQPIDPCFIKFFNCSLS